eukprot:3979626-Heterocapsa_arctica.AAC.1
MLPLPTARFSVMCEVLCVRISRNLAVYSVLVYTPCSQQPGKPYQGRCTCPLPRHPHHLPWEARWHARSA